MNNYIEDISESGVSKAGIISEDITRRGEDSLTTSNYSSRHKVSHLVVCFIRGL